MCFNKKKNIWISRQLLLNNALTRLSFNNLYKAIKYLLNMQLKIKEQNNTEIWLQIEKLSLIMCNYSFPTSDTHHV
ncbi:MAG: hypothetical protein FT671_01300 [Pantoea sp. Brub]|nr:hypothetical protein [Pantoea sp. Brub]